MDEELIRRYSRWHAAEQADEDDEADAAFKAVLAMVPDRPAPVQFTARTMAAVAAASARDARRARRTRAAALVGGALGLLVGAYYGAGYAVNLLSRGIIALLNVFVTAAVGSASAMERGVDIWALLGNLGRAGAAFISDPKVTIMLLAVQALAAAALFALQRLLETDRESFK